MAARKLQAEIDRTLKKVTEGVELFQSIYDKMQASTNQTQKEKLETDLKTQIKKLQRLRDQIKSWVASSDIKDKSVLLENRRLIETQMEKFKACEKEMKTKAFSKEGLTAALKLDPKAQEKLDTIAWLQTMVDDLGMQVEAAEAEIETLQGGTKKKGKGGGTAERLEELEALNERRKWNIGRLELILRLLENGSLPTEKVLAVKDDVQYFVESNVEEDFEADEGIYDDLNLEEVEGQFGVGGDEGQSEDESLDIQEDLPPRTPLKDMARKSSHDDPQTKKDEVVSPVLKKATVSRRKSTTESSRPPNLPNFAQQPMASVVKAGIPTPGPVRAAPPQLPPMRYSAAAAGPSAPVISSIPTNATTLPVTSLLPNGTSGSVSTADAAASASALQSESSGVSPPSPSFTHPSLSAASPVLSSVSTSGLPPPSQASRTTPPPESMSFDSRDSSPLLSEAIPAATSSPHRPLTQSGVVPTDVMSRHSPPPELPPDSSSLHVQANGSQETQRQLLQPPATFVRQPSPHGLPQPISQPESSTHQLPLVPPGIKPPQFQEQPDVPRPVQEHDSVIRPRSRGSLLAQPESGKRIASENQQTLPSSLSDLLISFDGAKQKAATRMNDLNHVHKILEAGYHNIPQPRDTSKPKYYVPRHPFQTPSYYPQAPHPVLSTPSVFAQIDVESLFYVFYYLPGTFQQYLAAKELKKQSWRFHVKYLTWFQRHSEPQAITEEYEQGVYVYFDWEGSWCQRKKSDFRFEYRYLSED